MANPGPGRTIVSVKAKKAIFSQGEPCGAIYYLQKGRATLTVTSTGGKEATIALLSPEDFLGEEAANSSVQFHPATATAVTACTALKIDRAELARVLHEQRRFSDLFVTFLLSRTMRIQDDLIDQLFDSSENAASLSSSPISAIWEKRRTATTAPKDQPTNARGDDRYNPATGFFMNRFRELGFIEYNGRIKVHKSLLRVLLQD